MTIRRQVLLQIIDKARADKDFLHDLVFTPDKALAKMEGLDEATKIKLKAINPGNFLAPQLVQAIGLLGQCDPTCTESCDGTCGSVSCNITCGPFNLSCKETCNISCGDTLDVARL
jgi:hypothetical protein